MVQKAQNKMLKILDGARTVNQKTFQEYQNMMSVNQIATQIKQNIESLILPKVSNKNEKKVNPNRRHG
jgi:hypothetical protein